MRTLSVRGLRLMFALVCAVALVSATGCAKKVTVRTGVVRMCTNGEELLNTVKSVEVPSKEAGRYSVKTETLTCPKHRQLERLYADAQAALSKGETETAQKILGTIMTQDPGFKDAAQKLEDIRGGSSGSTTSNGSTTTSPTTDPDAGTEPDSNPETPPNTGGTAADPVANLRKYVPASLTGYTARPAISDSVSVSREYAPADKDVAALVIVAEQFRSAADAKAAIASDIKGRYSKSGSTQTVAGHSVYVGTNGLQFIAAGWTEGSVAIEVELESARFESLSLKGTILAVVALIAG